MAVKPCPKCGESNSSSAYICLVCGTSLKDVDAVGTPEGEKPYFQRASRSVCNHCGEMNDADALKCKYCGSTLSRVSRPRSYYPSSGSDSYGCAVVLLFVATFFIPLVGLIVGGIFAFNDDPDKSSIGKALLIFGLFMIFIGFFLLVSVG